MIPQPESPDSQFLPLCGEQFAHGTHRVVHHVNGHPDLVIKIEKDTTFANWNEYLVSAALHGRAEPVAQLIGDVHSISATGKYLIMERLQDVDRSLSGTQYPLWLNDHFKRSAYGLTDSGMVKIRDFGTLKLGEALALYDPLFVATGSEKIVPNGHDDAYAQLQGEQIGSDGGRTVHSVKGYSNHVLKVCTGSHKANRVELLVYSALLNINASELKNFGKLECSRSGKFLLMERLSDLPNDFSGVRPVFPWWLVDQSDGRVGVNRDGDAKIRSFSDIRMGDVLARPPLGTIP